MKTLQTCVTRLNLAQIISSRPENFIRFSTLRKPPRLNIRPRQAQLKFIPATPPCLMRQSSRNNYASLIFQSYPALNPLITPSLRADSRGRALTRSYYIYTRLRVRARLPSVRRAIIRTRRAVTYSRARLVGEINRGTGTRPPRVCLGWYFSYLGRGLEISTIVAGIKYRSVAMLYLSCPFISSIYCRGIGRRFVRLMNIFSFCWFFSPFLVIGTIK